MSKRKITLAGKQSSRRIGRQQKRQHLIQAVVQVLSDWRCSPFENEGATRAGLRSAFCLEGHRWEMADQEASEIIADGLRLLGAERPSWAQGQREYVEPRENCRWCAVPLPEEEYGGLRRGYFCSAECGRQAILHRDLKTTNRNDRVAVAAHAIVAREAQPSLACEQCGKLFKQFTRTATDQRYCSHNCHQQSRRTIPVRECRTCGKDFRPKSVAGKAALYCSVICVYRRPLPNRRDCAVCNSPFAPGHEKSLFCSEKCNKRAYKIRHGMVKTISPPVFDYVFRLAA